MIASTLVSQRTERNERELHSLSIDDEEDKKEREKERDNKERERKKEERKGKKNKERSERRAASAGLPQLWVACLSVCLPVWFGLVWFGLVCLFVCLEQEEEEDETLTMNNSENDTFHFFVINPCFLYLLSFVCPFSLCLLMLWLLLF